MKNFFSIILSIAIAIVMTANVSAKSQKQTETAVFNVVPAMSCENCENKIKSNLRYEKGVSAIATDLKAQTVTVTYDPAKTNPNQISEAFKKIGYEATVGTATASSCEKKAGCCKKAEGQGCCKKAEGKDCGKKAEGKGCSKKAEGKDCCKKVEGQGCSKKAEGQDCCKKAEGQGCCKK